MNLLLGERRQYAASVEHGSLADGSVRSANRCSHLGHVLESRR